MAQEFAMIDDSRYTGDGPPLISDPYEELEQLSGFKMDMRKIKQWAHKNIQFLTFDDYDVINNGYDSDDEQGALDYAMKMSLEEPDQLTPPESSHQPPIPTDTPASTVDSMETTKGQCLFCPKVPSFPVHRKIRKFRLVSPRDILSRDINDTERVCRHYLAVSWCWPKDAQGNPIDTEATCQVREVDGRVRKARAPDFMLHRAVDVAISLQLRLIWIDKECLPQDDSDEYHRLGVQAMDIVYNRATATCGFLDAKITNQIQISAINALAAGYRTNTALPDLIAAAVQVIDLINKDNWYKRAWVIQEALSAGQGLLLALECAPGLSLSQDLILPDDKYDSTEPYDTNGRIGPQNFLLPVELLRKAAHTVKSYLFGEFTPVGQALMRVLHSSRNETEAVLRRALMLNPLAACPKSLERSFFSVGGMSYGMRPTCDAASALCLLRERECYRPHDRIAIMGNLCNYEIRLDSHAVGRKFPSLRLGMLALALINGDFSLLVPEVYQPSPLCMRTSPPQSSLHMASLWHKANKPADDFRQEPEPRYFAPFNRSSGYIAHCQLKHGKHRTPVCYNSSSQIFTKDGIKIRSYLWSVDRKVDLTGIRDQWAEKWHRFKCLTLEFVASKGQEGRQKSI